MKLAPTPDFAWPTFEVNTAMLLLDYAAVVAGGSSYRLGGKYPSSTDPKDVNAVDCSGFVRYLLTRRGVPIADGSQTQREWAKDQGLKVSSPADAEAEDGVLRLAVLPTRPGRSVGHVVLILNGRTIESHGGVGPDRRFWKDLPWRGECRVFVVSRP